MAVYGLSGQEELYHYGVLGMKWGVRRYQNKDGSLTAAGQRRVSKAYKKTSDRVTQKLNRNATDMYVNAYNRAAGRMNNGGIDRFNEKQRKKYGKDFAKREGYESDYNKLFDKIFVKEWNKSLNDFYSNDPDVKRGRELVKQYGMTSWDELAKNNEVAIEDVFNSVKEKKMRK